MAAAGSLAGSQRRAAVGAAAVMQPTRALAGRRMAYDGRGNAVVKSEADIAAAVASLGGYEKGLYAEK